MDFWSILTNVVAGDVTHIILKIIPSQLERIPQLDAMPPYLIQVIFPSA